jgi:hypothetical protein
MSGIEYGTAELNKLVYVLIKALQLDGLIDGTYPVLSDNYTLEIKTMQQWQLDQMPEFNGY